MTQKSAEIILIGKTIRQKLITSHLFSSFIPFLVILYLLTTYVFPRMPVGTIYSQVLIAFAVLLGVLVGTGYYVAWDLGRTFTTLARNAETMEGFEAFLERGDEVGVVMRAFSQTLEVLKQRTQEVSEFSAKLEAAERELEEIRLKLQQASYRDELTGAYNRRFFNLALEEEISRSQRYQHNFSLAIIRLSNLKEIREDYGDADADNVLVSVTELLKQNSRASDVVCRFGSDELAVVLPEGGSSGGRIYAEKMVSVVRNNEFRMEDGSTVNVKTSAGVTVYPSGGLTVEELVINADTALRRAEDEAQGGVSLLENPRP